MKFNIPILSRLWEVYQERQQYRKQVQHRLLRRRKIINEKTLESCQWTDKFLKSQVSQKFKLLTLLFFSVFFVQQSNAQVKPLQVGETMPEQLWQQPLNVTNSSSGQPTIQLADYKGKLIILDFWATWCAPCVALVPKMDSLQTVFKDRVQFVAVAYQTQNEIHTFLQKIQKEKNIEITIPQVYDDKLLAALFPHQTLPHYVWISGDGKILAFTSYSEITKDKINQQLNGNTNLTQKKEMKKVDYDPRLPLFSGTNGGNGSTLEYQRMFANYTEGLSPGYKFNRDEQKRLRITAKNQTLLSLYMLAYGEGVKLLNKNKVILEVSEPDRFNSNAVGNGYLEWMQAGNVFCYELLLPANIGDSQAFEMMREDLRNYFGNYEANLVKRKMTCLVLRKTGKSIPFATKGDKASIKMSLTETHLQNVNLSQFTGRLDSYYLQNEKLPLFDEVNYKGNIDLNFKAQMNSPESIDVALRPLGLKLTPEEREVEVLVIKEKKGGTQL
jgi:thiol-disulfide isomerase/thioredoxin